MTSRSRYTLSDYHKNHELIWRVLKSGVLRLPDGLMKSGVAREILGSYMPALRGFQGARLAVREAFARDRNLQLASDRRVYAALRDAYKAAFVYVVEYRREMRRQMRDEERPLRVTLREKIEAEERQRELAFEERQPPLGKGVGCGCLGYEEY